MAAIQPERIFQVIQAFPGILIAAIDYPTIGLEQNSRAKIAVAIPPVAGTGSRTAGAKDTFIQTINLLPVLL